MTEVLNMMIEGYDPQKAELEDPSVKDWKEIIGARQNDLIIQAELTGIENNSNKVCGIVYFGETKIKGIIPLEFSGCETIQQLRKLTGTKIAFKVINYDRENNVFIASRKAALDHMANITWKRLEKDQIIPAVVKDVRGNEIRVDIGGIMVDIPIQEVDYGWIDNLFEKVKIGDHLRVKVIELDKEKKIIKVSAKQVKPNPWPDCLTRYQKNGEYRGVISGIQPYGVFVNLEPGVDVLAHHMRFYNLQKGDRVLVRIIKIDQEKQQMSGRIVRAL